jgi:glycosyltransferase involved in cell wall biosynthesis
LDICCLASADWREGMWVNCHHIFSRLAAAGHRVLFIESTGLRAPSAGAADVAKTARRAMRFLSGVWRARANLHVVSPVVLPWADRARVLRTNRRLLGLTVRRALRRLEMRRPVFWSFLPTGELVAEAVDPSLVVYHCVDDYAANPAVPAEMVRRLERALVGRADLVFATSQPLADRLAAFGKPTHCLTNVAEVEHFAAARLATTGVPAEVAKLPAPRVGFVGNLAAYKVDLGLLAEIARRRPAWSLVLIGPSGMGDPGTDLAELAKLPNVHLLGEWPYGDLPGYLKAMDVCLLAAPAGSGAAAASFPLKFWEYVAAGKPVVARRTAALSVMDGRPHLCTLVAEGEDFAAAVEAAMAADGPEARAEREAACRGQGWTARIEEMLRLIGEALKARG